MPELTASAQREFNRAQQLYNLQQSIQNASVSKWSDVEYQNKQQKAFQKFYGYWKSKTLFTIQTPWRKFNNVAILSIDANQDEDTEEMSTFEIVFKQLRFAKDVNLLAEEVKESRSEYQSQQGNGVDRGVSNPVLSGTNFSDLYDITGAL